MRSWRQIFILRAKLSLFADESVTIAVTFDRGLNAKCITKRTGWFTGNRREDRTVIDDFANVATRMYNNRAILIGSQIE